MLNREETIEQIKYILDKLQPYLAADGGGVEYVDFDENNGLVKVRLLEACADCGMSDATLKLGIERALVDEVPGVNAVEAVE